MAFAAAETLARALRQDGPAVLKSRLIHTKTSSEPRLQLAPDARHAGDHDPHKEGRAVDIILLAWRPSEKAEADELVRIFRGHVDTMKWSGLIYNKVEWNAHGAEMPRLYRAKKEAETQGEYAENKAKFEHLSHIHIEWTDKDKDYAAFFDDLVKALQDDGTLGVLDAVGDMLNGTWDATIGSWSGIFKFTKQGTVAWFNSRSDKLPGGTGTWDLDTPGKLSWRFGNGDIRTFVTTLPLDVSETGDILPTGQGNFAMVKGAA